MVATAAVRDFLDGLVHPAVARDELESSRHRTFLLSHLGAGVLALAAVPIFLALRQQPTVPELVALCWMFAPFLVALDLSRTGRLERAHLLSSASLAVLIVMIAAPTGGLRSFAVVWLAILPFEAALSGSRRVVGGASALAVAAIAVLAGLEVAGATPGFVEVTLLPLLGLVFAILYAGALAIRWHGAQRKAAADNVAGERRYRLLAENLNDLLTRHMPDGKVVFASPAARSLVGLPPEDLLDSGLFRLVHVADRPAYLTALADAGMRGLTSSAEFRVRRLIREPGQDGAAPETEFIWAEMRCRPVLDDAEAENGVAAQRQVVAVTRDIGERKAQEEALLMAREDADRASLAKTRFLANMSHELRTPLNAIIGFSELLTTDELGPITTEKRKEYASLIHDSGMHLLSVVNGLLDMSKIESGNFVILPESFEIGPVVESCVRMFELKAADAGVSLVQDLAEDMPEITADPRACRQILINLLANAIKFTPAKGNVTVAARWRGGELALSVSDTGVGIAEEDIPRLGDAFFQARSSYDRPYEGTGLGLSVVKGLVALHGGTVAIESRLGSGTKVTIRLPREPAPVAPRKSGAVERLPQPMPTPQGDTRVKIRA